MNSRLAKPFSLPKIAGKSESLQVTGSVYFTNVHAHIIVKQKKQDFALPKRVINSSSVGGLSSNSNPARISFGSRLRKKVNLVKQKATIWLKSVLVGLFRCPFSVTGPFTCANAPYFSIHIECFTCLHKYPVLCALYEYKRFAYDCLPMWCYCQHPLSWSGSYSYPELMFWRLKKRHFIKSGIILLIVKIFVEERRRVEVAWRREAHVCKFDLLSILLRVVNKI